MGAAYRRRTSPTMLLAAKDQPRGMSCSKSVAILPNGRSVTTSSPGGIRSGENPNARRREICNRSNTGYSTSSEAHQGPACPSDLQNTRSAKGAVARECPVVAQELHQSGPAYKTRMLASVFGRTINHSKDCSVPLIVWSSKLTLAQASRTSTP